MAAVTTVHTLCSNSNNNKGSEKVNAETVNYYNTKHTHTDALSLSLSLTHTPTERHLNIAGVTAPVTATVAVVLLLLLLLLLQFHVGFAVAINKDTYAINCRIITNFITC